MSTTTYDLPLPRLYSEGSKEFYAAAKNHELRIQQCSDCGRYRFPPQLMCPECHSMDSAWNVVDGRGTIHTFTVIEDFEPRAVPMFSWPADRYPIIVVIVELPEADRVHLVSNLIDCDPADIYVGMEVEVVFDDVTEEFTLPKFRPSR